VRLQIKVGFELTISGLDLQSRPVNNSAKVTRFYNFFFPDKTRDLAGLFLNGAVDIIAGGEQNGLEGEKNLPDLSLKKASLNFFPFFTKD